MNDRNTLPPRPRFPWSAPDRPSVRDGRSPLSRDQIVGAAIRLADREGLEALSMRRLGHELGAGATSIYWHVRNKDELLDLVLDEVVGEVMSEVRTAMEAAPAEPSGDWRRALEAVARALRGVLIRHRHLASLMGERPTFGPKALDALEWLLSVLRQAGFSDRAAFLASTTLVNWAAGWAVFEVRDPVGPSVSDEAREAYLADVRDFLARLPADRYPNMAATMHLGFEVAPIDQFDYGLNRLLDGIDLDLRRGV